MLWHIAKIRKRSNVISSTAMLIRYFVTRVSRTV